MPAARQAGKLAPRRGRGGRTGTRAGPCRETRGRGRWDPGGAQRDGLVEAAAAAWHPPRARSGAAPAYLLRPGPRERPGSWTWAGGRASPWKRRRPGPASSCRSPQRSATPGRAGGCLGSGPLSRRCPLLSHSRRGRPISAPGPEPVTSPSGPRLPDSRHLCALSASLQLRPVRRPRQVRGAGGRARGALGLQALQDALCAHGGRGCAPASGSLGDGRGQPPPTRPHPPPRPQHTTRLLASLSRAGSPPRAVLSTWLNQRPMPVEPRLSLLAKSRETHPH